MLFNLISNKTGFKIDFIPLQNTEFEQIKFNSRLAIDFHGKIIWVISPEILIISKLAWIQDLVSENQLSDLENLLKINELDKEYIRIWIEKLYLKTYHLMI